MHSSDCQQQGLGECDPYRKLSYITLYLVQKTGSTWCNLEVMVHEVYIFVLCTYFCLIKLFSINSLGEVAILYSLKTNGLKISKCISV